VQAACKLDQQAILRQLGEIKHVKAAESVEMHARMQTEAEKRVAARAFNKNLIERGATTPEEKLALRKQDRTQQSAARFGEICAHVGGRQINFDRNGRIRGWRTLVATNSTRQPTRRSRNGSRSSSSRERRGAPSIIPMNVLTESRFGIGRNQLNEALKVIPNAADRNKVEWFWKYCFERNLGRDDVARLLRKPNGKDFYSHDSVYAILTGKRFKEGATETVVRMLRAIEEFQQQVQPKAGQDGFIETRLFSEIREYVNRARKLKRIGNIIGNMSVGKSESLLEIAERDPSVLYTQMPERGHYGDYLREVAEKCAISPRQNASTLRRNVVRALPEVLIVDDAHECFASMTSAWGLATLQFIKGSFDRKRKRLAVIFVWDTPGWAQFINGDHAHRLGRLWRRRMAPLRIDDVPYSDDLDLFAAAVGLDPAPAKIAEGRSPRRPGERRSHSRGFAAAPPERRVREERDRRVEDDPGRRRRAGQGKPQDRHLGRSFESARALRRDGRKRPRRPSSQRARGGSDERVRAAAQDR
jgi:hypothetical protein